ncbi:hypothetical protein OG292_23540 [Streptomyces sp. NBC_01511]|uniref:hypothetical protein n=1 Tax=Streptomyces sp. NBC_01511 TaxID=2903889 RepID=UPI00386DAF33
MNSPADRRNRTVIGRVVTGTGDFAGDWMAAGAGKVVVPLPAHRGPGPVVAARAAAGAREGGAAGVWVASFDVGRADESVGQSVLDAEQLWTLACQDSADTAPLLVAGNLLGCVLSRPGYALVAGTSAFVRGAVPEGVDGARARFRRYAERLRHSMPELIRVADRFPPEHHAWATIA